MAGIMFDLSDEYLPHQIVEQRAITQANTVAVKFGSKHISFSEFNGKADLLADAIALKAECSFPKVAVLLDPSLYSPVVPIAIFKLGGVYIPIDPEFPQSRIQSVVDQSKPDIVVTSADRRSQLPEGIAIVDIHEVLEADADTTVRRPSTVEIPLHKTAFIFFTSGTTGEPKGVKGSYSNLSYYTSSAIHRYSMNENTVMPAIAKFTFSISLFELITPLLAGGTVRVLPRAMITNPEQMSEIMTDVTMIHCGPALMRRLVDYLEQTFSDDELAARYSHLFHVSMGGDLVPVELLNRLLVMFKTAEVFVIYGCSEISCMGTTQRYYQHSPPAETLVGIPFDGVDLCIVDDQGAICSDGEKGQVCFNGPGVTSGYLNRDELTAEKYQLRENQIYYNTGDIGVVNSKGELKLLGRKDFQVKINGIRIELAEVDAHLRKAPYLDQLISMAFDTENGDKAIYAYVTQALTPPQIFEIRTYLKASVQEVMHPRAFVQIDRLPTNLNLKIDRKALPIPSIDNLILESEAAPAETNVQRQLLSIWRSVLGNPTLGIDDDFFDFGGTSLSSIDIAKKIEDELGVNVPLNELLLGPTVRLLSGKLDDIKSGHKTSGMIMLRRGKKQGQVVFVHDGNGDVIPYFSLAQKINSDINVYGLAPKSEGKIETVHTSIAQMVGYYCDEISRLDLDHGVSIGGLCIGGFVAFCVVAELEKRGIKVNNLFLFDSHYVDAIPHESDDSLSNSANRLTQVMTQLDAKQRLKIFLKKIISFSKYRIIVLKQGVYKPLKMLSLMSATKLNLLQCWVFPTPDVDTVLRRCETKYRNSSSRPTINSAVVFFKAMQSQDDLEGIDELKIDDTPYKYYFKGDVLGWDIIVDKDKLTKIEVGAGHSTMLINRYVGSIADVVNKKLNVVN